MLDHVTLRVCDIGASRAFYSKTLAALGYTLGFDGEHDGIVMLGFADANKKFDTWFVPADTARPVSGPLHICWRAQDRAMVDAFYAAALAASGRDNGPPGLRPQYHASYYGAFVLDPDGNNIEAVCHHAE